MENEENYEETAGSEPVDEAPAKKKSIETEKTMAWWLLRKCFKSSRPVLKPVLFIFLNGIYLLIGALVFVSLERKTGAEKLDISTEILEIVKAMNDTGSALNSDGLTLNMSVHDLEIWQTVLSNIYQRRVVAENSKWTLAHSVYFCTSLLTTIGYGNVAPATTPGRIFCILYCCIGIPFTIIFLAVLGKSMANVINKFVAEFIRLWTNYLHPNYEWKSLKDKTEINAPVWLALIIFLTFLLFSAFIYSISEDWGYWTACYFTFITFTTIGLGDVVPERTETMIFIDTTLLYLGLAVLALTVNLIVANVVDQLRKTREKLSLLDRLELSSAASE